MFQIKSLISWLKTLFALGCLSISLYGCGWTPLYGPSAPQTLEALQSVKVDVIADRSGQVLRNYLIDALNPHGIPQHPAYRLSVELQEAKRPLGFRLDATARREEITLTAHFELIDLTTQTVVLQDKAVTVSGYTLGAQADIGSFSSIVAEKSVREQALRTLSEDITLKLADYAHHRTQPARTIHED